MDKSVKAWQDVLEEFDAETAFWIQFCLPSVNKRCISPPGKTDAVNHVKDTALRVASANKIYPYVEGLDEPIGAALHWMKKPQKTLTGWP